MFEPLPEKGLLEKMRQFVENGGKVVWFSAPPLVDATGERCDRLWQELFGVEYPHDVYMGEIAAGKKYLSAAVLHRFPNRRFFPIFW